jgi:hypothetical protein
MNSEQTCELTCAVGYTQVAAAPGPLITCNVVGALATPVLTYASNCIQNQCSLIASEFPVGSYLEVGSCASIHGQCTLDCAVGARDVSFGVALPQVICEQQTTNEKTFHNIESCQRK